MRKAERVLSEVFPGFGISILVKYDFETSLGNLLLIKSTAFRMRLLSHFSRVRLCAPPSMGFSRQEYWSGVPLPSPRMRLSLF